MARKSQTKWPIKDECIDQFNAELRIIGDHIDPRDRSCMPAQNIIARELGILKPPPTEYIIARVRQRQGCPYEYSGLASPQGEQQFHLKWRQTCFQLQWPVLPPHNRRELKAARRIERSWRYSARRHTLLRAKINCLMRGLDHKGVHLPGHVLRLIYEKCL
jgi:hypothetical protein